MPLRVGATVSLMAATLDATAQFLRHYEGRALISPITHTSLEDEKLDASWVVRAPLATTEDEDGSDPARQLVSFESVNFPGGYLRHANGRLYQGPNDETEQFALDATFISTTSTNGRGIELAAVNFPDNFLRHFEGELYIATKGGPELWDAEFAWDDDVTWIPRRAWA